MLTNIRFPYGARLSVPFRMRRAITLVEMMVVIAIIAIIAAITLPALSIAREKARQMACASNLKQLGTAIALHESTHETLPHGGVDYYSPPVYDGNTPRGPEHQYAGWGFQILPYLNEKNLWDQGAAVAISTPVEVFGCPSRGPRLLPARDGNHYDWYTRTHTINGPIEHASTDYASSFASAHGVLDPGDPANAEYFQPALTPDHSGQTTQTGCIVRLLINVAYNPPTLMNSLINSGDITDGTSNTIMLAEKRMNVAHKGENQIDDDGGFAGGWDFDTQRNTTIPPEADYRGPLAAHPLSTQQFLMLSQFGSSHGTTFNVLRADGSTKALHHGLDRLVFHRLGHRMDGKRPNQKTKSP
jgi:prepilin-type N-terminal cleavage/methylation domain-containing protein